MVTKFSFHLYSPSELTLHRASCYIYIYSVLIVYIQYLGKVILMISFLLLLSLSYYRILLILVLTSFSRITRSHLKWTREATFTM